MNSILRSFYLRGALSNIQVGSLMSSRKGLLYEVRLCEMSGAK